VGEDQDTDYGLLLGDAGTQGLRAPVRVRADFVLKIAVVAGLLVALVLILAGVPLLAADDGTAGPVRNLGKVVLEPVPGDLPRVVAEVGQTSRVQAMVLREVGPQVYRPVLTRRLGVVEAGTVTLELGSGHASDGLAPGDVLDTSRMIPFTVVPGQGGGLAPGRYTVTVQMRSVD
jgi:hypothetical protein